MRATQAGQFPETQYSALITKDKELDRCKLIVMQEFASGDASITAVDLDNKNKLNGGGSKRKNLKKENMDYHTLKSAQGRAVRTVRKLALQFLPDRMLTLTFKENLTDLTEARKRQHYFLKLVRHRWPEFTYITVPELQKRGAVHFHLAIRGYHSIRTLRTLWLRAAGTYGGNVDITNPKKYGKNSWNPKRIAQYLAKYISKDDIVDFNSRRYSSGGVIPPIIKTIGFIAVGLPMYRFADQILQVVAGKSVAYEWDSHQFCGVQYFST